MLQYDTDTEYDTVFEKDCFFYFYYPRFKVPDSSQCPFLKYGVMFTFVCQGAVKESSMLLKDYHELLELVLRFIRRLLRLR